MVTSTETGLVTAMGWGTSATGIRSATATQRATPTASATVKASVTS
jgi:hypothetical protein